MTALIVAVVFALVAATAFVVACSFHGEYERCCDAADETPYEIRRVMWYREARFAGRIGIVASVVTVLAGVISYLGLATFAFG